MKLCTIQELGTEWVTFIHAKIYIIDDSVVYFGSLNFTNSGVEYNLETQIRTEDKDTVNEVIKLFNNLFDNFQVAGTDITKLGKKIYREQLNNFPV